MNQQTSQILGDNAPNKAAMKNIWRKCLLSWQIPSIGFGLTFLLGLGFSYSSQDIRSEVQSVGSVVITLFELFALTNATETKTISNMQSPDY